MLEDTARNTDRIDRVLAFVARHSSPILRAAESRAFVPFFLTLAALTRLAWVLVVDVTPITDDQWYLERARSLVAGHGYALRDGTLTAFFPPGYSFFLAALGHLFGLEGLISNAQLANVAFDVGSCWLAGSVAQQLFRSRQVGRITLAIAALHPARIAYCELLLNEVWFLFLLLLGSRIILEPLQDRRAWFASIAGGCVFGLAALTKPQVLFIPAILYLLTGRRRSVRQNAQALAIVYLLIISALAPWAWRNHAVFGMGPKLSANGGYNLLMGHNEYARGGHHWDARIRDEIRSIRAASPDEMTADATLGEMARASIASHPARVVTLIPSKLAYLYAHDLDAVRFNRAGLPGSLGQSTAAILTLNVIFQAYYLVVLALSGLGIIAAWRSRRAATRSLACWAPLAIVAYFSFLYGVVFFGAQRFHFPLVPWLTMYAALLPGAIGPQLGPTPVDQPRTTP